MFVNIWITSRCNLSCEYCYEGKKKKDCDITVETIDNIIEYIKKNKELNEKLVVEFHGGEPLLCFDNIKYCIEKLKKIFYKELLFFGITTNGVLLTEEKAAYLSENMNYNLSISIDGNKESNDRYRRDKNGHGTYEMVAKKSSLLTSKTSKVRARMTILPSEVPYIYENCVALVKLGFINIASEIDYFNPEWNEEHFKQIKKQADLLKRYKDELNCNLKFSLLNYYQKKKGICNFGKKYFNVNSNGDIYPCTYLVGNEEFILGNINKVPFQNKSLIDKLKRINHLNNLACKGCKQIQYCPATRCKFVNKSITGNYCSPPATICAMQNLKFQMALDAMQSK